MLLAEGSKQQQSHGWASHMQQRLWQNAGIASAPQSCRAAGPHTRISTVVYCASMLGRQGAMVILCSPVPSD